MDGELGETSSYLKERDDDARERHGLTRRAVRLLDARGPMTSVSSNGDVRRRSSHLGYIEGSSDANRQLATAKRYGRVGADVGLHLRRGNCAFALRSVCSSSGQVEACAPPGRALREYGR